MMAYRVDEAVEIVEIAARPFWAYAFLNSIRDESALKKDRNGNIRTAYSLRQYLHLLPSHGEKFYASHIKTTLDAAAINVREGTIRRDRKPRKDQ